MKLVLAVSGASGVGLAEKFVEYLPIDENEIELHVVVSESASVVAHHEMRREMITMHHNDNIAASIASGSFQVDATAVIPCSMNTLAKIAHGIADNLITRVASVALKEQKRLLLAPREMPLSSIALENMHKLSTLGVTISPPMLGYYSDSDSIDDMERFIIGKWYDTLGIRHKLYRRWS
ncbi:UbiX family decarboxylase associated with menaquinone via futalosine [hydrothermal vent metagenome]|uniref:UbiX family decarboxylase associated with menaquinone via futalosine n=1 Tax=hydrothermal vent metagenome TaxID=652676 RepID=A0A1W1C7V0_9ZZZZ